MKSQNSTLSSIYTKGYFSIRGYCTEYPLHLIFFQHVLKSVLQNIPNVVIYQDNILIICGSEEDHFKTTSKSWFAGQDKQMEFRKTFVDYLGHRINEHGLHSLPNNVEAILCALASQSVQKLKSYLEFLHIVVNSYQICLLLCFCSTDYSGKVLHGDGLRRRRKHFVSQMIY